MAEAPQTRVVIEAFTITFDDYNAMILNQPSNRLVGWKAHALILAMAGVNIAASAVFLSFERAPFGYGWISYVNGALGVFVLAMSYGLRPLLLRRHYAAAALRDNPLRFEADETSMRSSRKGLRSEFDWPDLLCWSETEKHLFFWINKIQAVIVPKRALTEPDIETLHGFVRAAGVEKIR